jgi:large subunit ribosomal protein L4e
VIIMKAKVFGIDGADKGSVDLPKVFETSLQPTVIKRAVLALQTARLQPKGTDPRAGLKNTAIYIGTRDQPGTRKSINTGKARLPRLKNRRHPASGRVARVPQSVGGRRAHPPKAQKIIVEKINKKEKRLALASAIAATANKELVEKRFIVEGELPIVVEDTFEGTSKTKEVVLALAKIGAGKDLENAKSKTRKRAGKGKARGRTKKQKKSVLVITKENSKVLKACRNLPGVESVTVQSLNVELLAPGAEAGRLVIWTKGAIERLANPKKTEKVVKKTAEKKIAKKKVVKKVVKKKVVKKE